MLILALAGPMAATAQTAHDVAHRAELMGSEQFIFHSSIQKRDLLIQVIPPLNKPTVPVPAVYMTDSEQSIWAGVLAAGGVPWGEFQPAYFIGIAYPELDVLHWNRQRVHDLTHVQGQDLGAFDERLSGVQTGGGADYERFLIEELKPEIERRYPVDPKQAVLSGFSLGGLFTANVLVRHPEAFNTFLIGSPSMPLQMSLVEDAKAAKIGRDVRVFIGVGSAEDDKMVQGAFALTKALKANPTHPEIVGVWVGQGLSHVQFIGEFMTRALTFALQPR